MKRTTPLRLLSVLVAPLLFAALEARAEIRRCEIEPALLQLLLGWIGNQSDYDVGKAMVEPPDIVLCDEGDTIDYEGRAVVVDPEIKGLYDLEKRRVVLKAPWDQSKIEDQAVLLHELIHHLQWTSRAWECPGAPEPEAYRPQEQWLAERGVDAGFNWLVIEVRSRCLRDIHPFEEAPGGPR